MRGLTFIFLAATLISSSVQAGVIVGATRVIYESGEKEVSLHVNNPEEKRAYLIQTWVDNESETNTAKTPFIITPPLYRLNAGQENQMRIIATGNNLPTDRESVFWLNVKSIPSVEKSDRNRLLISVNTRIKLFWRPAELKSKPADVAEAYKKLSFTARGNTLRVTNPTPYYVSFSELKVGGRNIENPGMVPPKGEAAIAVQPGTSGKITWKAINDYGGATQEATQ